MRSRILIAASALVLTTAVGCVKQDTEILSRVGKRALDQGRDATAGLRDKVASYLPASAGAGGDSLEERVGQRLRTDKSLQGVKFEVIAHGGEIELKGNPLTDDQKRRAAELAESTAGVEKVTDHTVTPGPTLPPPALPDIPPPPPS
jgi:osmotically-inducible protein OsmY